MPSRRVPLDLNAGTYYLTLTVWRWYYLFDRYNRWQILADSLRYCQEHKGLKLNGYVFMLNHIHLIVISPDVGGFLRDFKRFTSKKAQGESGSHRAQCPEPFRQRWWELPILDEYQRAEKRSRTPISTSRSSITCTRIR